MWYDHTGNELHMHNLENGLLFQKFILILNQLAQLRLSQKKMDSKWNIFDVLQKSYQKIELVF